MLQIELQFPPIITDCLVLRIKLQHPPIIDEFTENVGLDGSVIITLLDEEIIDEDVEVKIQFPVPPIIEL